MNKSHLTEADREYLLCLQAVAARPAEREQRRRQGLSPTLRQWPVDHPDGGKSGEVDCGDRQETGRLH